MAQEGDSQDRGGGGFVPERILIVRLSALGDTALTLPLLWALRRSLPEAHLGWVVGANAAPLLRGLSGLDRLHVLQDGWAMGADLPRIIRDIRAERYALSLDPQGITRSALLPFLAGIRRRAGFGPGAVEGRELAPILTNHRLRPPKDWTHVCQRNLYLGCAAGLRMPVNVPLNLPRVPAAERKTVAWWRKEALGKRTLVFAPGAGWPTKRWPVREMCRLVRAARRRGWKSILLWGPRESRCLGRWQGILGDEVSYPPPTSIPEMIALLRGCAGYVGADSAPLHLAWLLAKPTFSWFGASDPARCAPRGERHRHVARGPHDWRRKETRSPGLRALQATEVLPEFRDWLSLAVTESQGADVRGGAEFDAAGGILKPVKPSGAEAGHG